MANPFVHIELHTQDPDKAKKFYTSMFNWKLEEFPGMDYTTINVGYSLIQLYRGAGSPCSKA